jgi:DNA-binding MarR family transcriptional regulator
VDDAEPMTERVVFLLAKLGQVLTGRFAERLEPLGLRPRLCTVLELLAAGPLGQLALAQRLGVTPSVVVDMLDELERIGAVGRARDTVDRRRQVVALTEEGARLRIRAGELAAEMDRDLMAALDPSEGAALRDALRRLGVSTGVTAG